MAEIFLHLTEYRIEKNEIEKVGEKNCKENGKIRILRETKGIICIWQNEYYYRSLIIHRVNLNYHLAEKTEK